MRRASVSGKGRNDSVPKLRAPEYASKQDALFVSREETMEVPALRERVPASLHALSQSAHTEDRDSAGIYDILRPPCHRMEIARMNQAD